MEKDEKKRLKDVDDQLVEISKNISFMDINPTNIEEEKERFFKGKEKAYNPVFKYEKLSFSPKRTIKKLDKLDIRYTHIDKFFREKVMKHKNLINLLSNRGSTKITRFSTKIYGEPDPTLVSKTKEIMKLKSDRKEEKQLTTKQIIRMLNTAFMRFGFNWSVIEKDMAASAAVLISKKQLAIKTKSKFPKSFVKRLIVHEIGTHILRAENGSKQPYKIFKYGLPNYMMTEEGLAVINEELNKCLENATLKRYASRVLAVDKALKSSFRETFDYLKKHGVSDDAAWKTTVRVKRGLKDSSEPGAFTKDHLYLKGYVELKKFLEKKGDINKLYYGKVGLEDIDKLEKIPGLINPIYLPFFRYFQFFIEITAELVKFNIKTLMKPVLYPFDISNYRKIFDKISNFKSGKSDSK